MPLPKSPKLSSASTATIGFEAKFSLAADKLRNNVDMAEYKRVALGLIFLKYISDTYEEHRAKLFVGEGDHAGVNAEDPNEPSGARQPAREGSPKGQRGGAEQYKAENVFWVPAEARWSHLQASAKQPVIGKTVDDGVRWQWSGATWTTRQGARRVNARAFINSAPRQGQRQLRLGAALHPPPRPARQHGAPPSQWRHEQRLGR